MLRCQRGEGMGFEYGNHFFFGRAVKIVDVGPDIEDLAGLARRW
jgi:hypothetical protein